ncbi:MAG TPA: MptD family putative ECF transporter S component, partial [Atopostipes sp.]|nr:MptD family putative ECF transporter S component [Atopostipes sp.]
YISELVEAGKDATYIQNVFSSISQNTFYLLIAGIFIAAVIGGLFGQRMMNKHFKKAGIV